MERWLEATASSSPSLDVRDARTLVSSVSDWRVSGDTSARPLLPGRGRLSGEGPASSCTTRRPHTAVGNRTAARGNFESRREAKRGRISASRIVVHRARQDRPNRRRREGRCSHRSAARSARRFPMDDGRSAARRRSRASEKTSAGVLHVCAGDSLGRAVGPPHRRAKADALERFDDAEAARAGFVRRDEDVAQMQGAMADAGGPGEIDGAGELRDERQRLVERARARSAASRRRATRRRRTPRRGRRPCPSTPAAIGSTIEG